MWRMTPVSRIILQDDTDSDDHFTLWRHAMAFDGGQVEVRSNFQNSIFALRAHALVQNVLKIRNMALIFFYDRRTLKNWK